MKQSVAISLLLLCAICLPHTLRAQKTTETPEDRPMQMALSAMFGSATMTDSYLSPYKYSGWNSGIVGERLRYYKGNSKMLGFQSLYTNFARSTYGSGNGLTYAAQIDYSYAALRSIYKTDHFHLLAGASTSILAGVMYNERNSNNPANAKANIDLNFNAMLSYRLKINNYPLSFRLTLATPIAGIFFSPEYGQSYYEMFIINNREGIIHFGSLHNHQALRGHLSLDLPCGNGAFRIGYLCNINRTEAHSLISYSSASNFTIGYVVQFCLTSIKKRSLLNLPTTP